MKTFLRDIAAFLALQGVILAILVLLHQPDDNAYALTLRDKHARVRDVTAPAVLLVGGSNVSCSMDSGMLSRSIDRPVVNLGLLAPLGLAFQLREAEALMGPGDMIVLSPEYENFHNAPDGAALW